MDKSLLGELVGDVKPPVGRITNALILLHGFGDSHASLFSLGQSLNLPGTLVVSVQGPLQVPFMDDAGWMWSDDVIFDDKSNGICDDGGFKKASDMVHILMGNLAEQGISAERVVFFGYGQGGMLALSIAATIGASVISIGGVLPEAVCDRQGNRCLICGGDSNSKITSSEVTRLKNHFKTVSLLRWKNQSGDALPKTSKKNAWRPILEFLSKVIIQKSGIPDGAIQIN